MGREPVAIAIEVALGAYAAHLLLRPNRQRWGRYVAVRWPAYAAAWRRLPRATRRRARRAVVRGRSAADVPDLLGLANIEITDRVFRAWRLRAKRRLPVRVAALFAVFPVVVLFLFVTGGRVWRMACVAGFALLVTLALSFARQGLRTRWLPARVAQARAATHAELERRGEDSAGVRTLAVGLPGKEVRALLADAAPRRHRPLGGWVPIVAFLAAALLVAAWADTGGGTAVPADLRVPASARVNGDPLDDVFEYLSSYLTYDGANLSTVLSRATPGERMTYVLEDVDEEIGNGGFEQLYWNPDGALVPDAIRYARKLGARSYAHALEVSTAVFPGGVVPGSEAARQRIIGPFESKRAALTKADALWRERAYAPALRAYVRAHPSEFFR